MSKNNGILITVKFFATLRKFGPAEELIKLVEDSTVKSIFDKYKIPKEERRTIILVNGRPHRDLKTILQNGDIIAIFPPIGGG